MAGVESVGLVLAVLPLVTTAFRLAYNTALVQTARTYRKQRFSWPLRVLNRLFIFDADNVQELQRDINKWTNEEILSWKESYIASCNAIAVAGAIFASVGLTALQLPNMDDVHWSARALFIVSMMFGILSVVSATSQHRNIGLLNNALALRLWLSRGRTPEQHKKNGTWAYPPPYDEFLLDSSVSAVLLTQFPRMLLNVAVLLYVVGFGLYLLFSWVEDVPDSTNNYRNIFVVFVVALGCSVIYHVMCRFSRILEEKKVADDFNFKRLGTTIPHDADLEALGKAAEGPLNPGARHEQELLQAIRALTAEVTNLRQSIERRP